MAGMVKKWFLSGIMILSLMAFSVSVRAAECAENSSVVMPTGDMAVREPSKPMEMLSSADAENLNEQMAAYTQQEDSLLINKAEHFYYYENLDPIAREIYDVMYQVAQDPVSEGNIGLMMTDMDPQSEEYYYEFNVANRALCFDHPELFWLYSGEQAEMGFCSEAVNQNGFYFVYILMIEPFTGFEAQMTAFNQAAAAFLAEIDTTISEYDTIRQIHDKLLALVNYNDPVAEETFRTEPGQDLAHTAYGALVEDSSGVQNAPVCDGYTLAFEYLLQQCGIETLFVGGMAGSTEEDAGGHAWSMVKADGVWYEVDCTWDDVGSMQDDQTPGTEDYRYLEEVLSNTEYREKAEHSMFLVSTERLRHFVAGDEFTYITQDQMYIYQLVQDSVHIRFGEELSQEEYDYDSAIISLAPTAMQSYGS